MFSIRSVLGREAGRIDSAARRVRTVRFVAESSPPVRVAPTTLPPPADEGVLSYVRPVAAGPACRTGSAIAGRSNATAGTPSQSFIANMRRWIGMISIS